MRCKVNYGVPDPEKKKKKRLAIPYEAADIPSKRNDFEHPEVSILLTYLAYYNTGLTGQEMKECIDRFLELTQENMQARINEFGQWLKSLSDETKAKLQIDNAQEIKQHSDSQKERIYKAFRLNRRCINYWLRHCVFEKDTAQFKNSITSSSWDQSNVETAMGFSGTKDNCRLLPSYMHIIEAQNKEIAGTDGKMVEMLLQHVREVKPIIDGKQPLW